MTTGRLLPGAILIILGALFLAANFGYLDWGFVVSLWQLWPLILVAIGVQLFVGARRQWLAAVLVLAIIIGGAAFVAFGTDRTPWDFGGALRTTRIDGPASAGVREAEARIDVGAARIDIASSRGGVMTEGTLESRRDPQVTHNVSNGVYTLEVLQKKGVQIFHSGIQGDRLVLDLAQGVPWKIDVDTGAADANLDLRGVTLSELTVDAGASSLDLTLGPDIVGGARVSVDGGAGSYRLRLPRDLDITLTIDAGVSSVNVDGAFQRTGDVYRLAGAGEALSVDINAGVSSISVELY